SCLQFLAFNLGNDGMNVSTELVNSGDGGFQLGIELGNFDHFAVVLGVDIAADGQVVVIRGDLLERNGLGKVLHVRLAVEHRHDLVDVGVQQHVVVGFLVKQAAGVDELGGGVGLVFGQHQNVHGDGGAVEQVGRERDHRFHVVVVHQVLANLLL